MIFDFVEEFSNDARYTVSSFIFEALGPCFLAVVINCSEDVLVLRVLILEIVVDLYQISLDTVEWAFFVHYHILGPPNNLLTWPSLMTHST